MLAAASICFDFSVFELFVPLSRGATVVLVEDLLALIRPLPGPATLVSGVPSAFGELLRHVALPESVRIVMVGGEAVRNDLVVRLAEQPSQPRVMECYGPTETTIFATVGERLPNGPVTIGAPIAGWRVRIVDERGRPVAIGATGELQVGGAGVSAGYLGRPELTSERFIAGADGEVWYRTGDLARWREDGRIEFVGRADTQVKLRGFRIELGEIEAVLTEHPAVAEAVVAIQSAGEGDDQLVAWWQPAPHVARPDSNTLRRYLRERLPLHMVAQQFVAVEAWPRLANGKIDRKNLPEPFAAGSASAPVSSGPSEAMLERMRSLWAEAIGHEIEASPVDTFIDVGGHSLLAVRAVAAARGHYGVEIPVRAMLLDSLAQLALRLEADDQPPPDTSRPTTAGDTAATDAAGGDAEATPANERGGLAARLRFGRRGRSV